jgi:hypothetical protein
MKRRWSIALVFIAFAIVVFAQDETPMFKARTTSALVWDEDLPDSASSSTVWDPLTGRTLHKLSHGGIEVSSRMGYERTGLGQAGKLLNYTTTIANHTDSDATVQYGGVVVDGRATLPLRVALTHKSVPKRDRKSVWELSKMACFKSGFASTEHFFSLDTLTTSFTVPAQTAMTISVVVKDPRSHSALCSVDGCQITGTLRYYVTVNGKDYVFVWPGKAVVYCGE